MQDEPSKPAEETSGRMSSGKRAGALKTGYPRITFCVAGHTFLLLATAPAGRERWHVGVFLVDEDARQLSPILLPDGVPLSTTDRWSLAYLSMLARLERQFGTAGRQVLGGGPRQLLHEAGGVPLHDLSARRPRQT